MECAVCNKKDIKTKFKKDSAYIKKCGFCGYEFVYPRVGQEKLSRGYNQNRLSSMFYYLENQEAERKMVRDRYAKIKSFIPRKGVLLDVGCNIGVYSEVFYENGWEVYGIDINKSAIDYLKDKPFKVFNCLIENLNISKRFDLILMNDVIEHFRDPNAAMNKVVSLLKRGGYILLSTPITDSIISKISGSRWLHYKPDEHLQYFNRSNLKMFLKKYGFEIKSIFKVTRYRNLYVILEKSGTYIRLPHYIIKKLKMDSLLKKINLKLTLGDEVIVLAKKNGRE